MLSLSRCGLLRNTTLAIGDEIISSHIAHALKRTQWRRCNKIIADPAEPGKTRPMIHDENSLVTGPQTTMLASGNISVSPEGHFRSRSNAPKTNGALVFVFDRVTPLKV